MSRVMSACVSISCLSHSCWCGPLLGSLRDRTCPPIDAGIYWSTILRPARP